MFRVQNKFCFKLNIVIVNLLIVLIKLLTVFSLARCSEMHTYVYRDMVFQGKSKQSNDLDLYRITRGFNRTLVTGEACKQGVLTLLDTWFRPFWDLLMLQLLRPVYRNLHVFSRLFALKTVLSRICLVRVSLSYL